jgi:hypothetical protein
METAKVRQFLLAPALTLFCLVSPIAGDEPTTGETFLLRYSLDSGEQLRFEVTHVAKTKTRVRGTEEVTQVHTTSQRRWDVVEASDSAMTFEHVIDAVEMSQQRDEGEEIRWNSSTDEEAPPAFAVVAGQIGEKLATVTVNPQGEETEREDHAGTKASLGMGSLTLSLPEKPIALGHSWIVSREVQTRTDEGEVKPIKINERYRLEKVKTGVATISVKSEPITPINEESVRAQVVQQLSNGVIRFDIDNGRMLSKQLDWDETVVGFQGANSLMEYRAKLTETFIDAVERTASRN